MMTMTTMAVRRADGVIPRHRAIAIMVAGSAIRKVIPAPHVKAGVKMTMVNPHAHAVAAAAAIMMKMKIIRHAVAEATLLPRVDLLPAAEETLAMVAGLAIR